MYKNIIKKIMSSKFAKLFLQILAMVLLLIELVFSVIIPKLKSLPVDLSMDDYLIVVGSTATLTSFKTLIDWIKNKLKINNNS